MNKKAFSRDILILADADEVIASISQHLKSDILTKIKRRGAIVGISGGIDSSVALALAVHALGAERVTGVLMPEADSNEDSRTLAMKLAGQFGVQTIEENITAALSGLGCYGRRDDAVKRVFPEYDGDNFKMKIGINPEAINRNLPPVFYLTIVDKQGQEKRKIIPIAEYLQIVAASNFKQRTRMSMLYYHAERLHYAVVGTPNKHEVEQGFFVKHGDGGADIMPIAHFYKTQVYQLARALDIPEEIVSRTPTSDTYSAEQTQQEFFFQLPFEEMDLLWYGYENGYCESEVSAALGKSKEEVQAIYKTFSRKQKTTEYLRLAPIRFEQKSGKY